MPYRQLNPQRRAPDLRQKSKIARPCCSRIPRRRDGIVRPTRHISSVLQQCPGHLVADATTHCVFWMQFQRFAEMRAPRAPGRSRPARTEFRQADSAGAGRGRPPKRETVPIGWRNLGKVIGRIQIPVDSLFVPNESHFLPPRGHHKNHALSTDCAPSRVETSAVWLAIWGRVSSGRPGRSVSGEIAALGRRVSAVTVATGA